MSTITLHPIVQSYKDRITEAFEAEGYTVTSVDVDTSFEQFKDICLDFGLEDRENDAIAPVRFWFYEEDVERIEERRSLEEMMAEGRIDPEDVDDIEDVDRILRAHGFEVDLLHFAYDEAEGRSSRDAEEYRQVLEILRKHFVEDLDFCETD